MLKLPCQSKTLGKDGEMLTFKVVCTTPRKACIDAPGALHHIIIRGIERKVINDSQDYSNLLNRLKNVLTETKTPCFAWALMINHLLC
jgi:hypothetical protein